MKKYETYLFDWDGTLADTLDIWLKSHGDFIRSRGIQLTDAEISWGVFTQFHFVESLGLGDDPDTARYYASMPERLKSAQLVPGAIETLNRLVADGHKLGIVTSSHRPNMEVVINNLGIGRYFSTSVCAEDVQKHKPNPEPVLKAMQNLEADPETTVYVGDTFGDILAGEAAGVSTVLVHDMAYHEKFYPLDRTLAECQPDYQISSLIELL